MRRRILICAVAAALALPAIAFAAAKTYIYAKAGGVNATLSYSGGPGITTADERLMITQSGQPTYDQPVPAKGCIKVCSPVGKHSVQVTDVYGDGSEEVVLTLFSGGADCCTIGDVYVHSSAMQSWVLDQHNFGEAGFLLKPIGPHRRPLFVSANPAFYCRFTFCYASALPLQILEFQAERFVDVTKQYPKLISADAKRWLSLYYKDPKNGLGAIAAWAADDDQLGSSYQGTVRTVLQLQVADGHLKQSFVAQLERFLAKQHYT